MRLGMDNYLPKYKQCEEALVINISSITGLTGLACYPVYSTTKHAILGMVKSWGSSDIYNENKVRVVGICPGVTSTSMLKNIMGTCLDGVYEKISRTMLVDTKTQE